VAFERSSLNKGTSVAAQIQFHELAAPNLLSQYRQQTVDNPSLPSVFKFDLVHLATS